MPIEHFRGGVHLVDCNQCGHEVEKKHYPDHLMEHAGNAMIELCRKMDESFFLKREKELPLTETES